MASAARAKKAALRAPLDIVISGGLDRGPDLRRESSHRIVRGDAVGYDHSWKRATGVEPWTRYSEERLGGSAG